MFPEMQPKPKLRAQSVMANEAARDIGMRINRNMTVPDDSVIGRVFRDHERGISNGMTGLENLGDWRHSDGSTLGDFEVTIEARPIRDSVVALVTPVE